MTDKTSVVNKLIETLHPDAVVCGAEISERPTSYWNASPMQAKIITRPRSTSEVQDILTICHEYAQPIVTQGGMTGCVEGANSKAGDVILSMERMTAIEEIDEMGGTTTVQAGVVLQTLQEKVQERGLYFPLDLGARGSCTIGGNVATNAGGVNVIRYGMMRNLVLGLEAVLSDGTLVSSMNHMLKNNTGYDLKQLFIGSEGTLGVITKIVLKLGAQPSSRFAVLTALDDFSSVTHFLNYCQKQFASKLTAFELMWGEHYRAVTEPGWNKSPMDRGYGFYAIVECEGQDAEADAQYFEKILGTAFEENMIVDAVLPKSERERKDIWKIRESFEAIFENDPVFLYDVSLPIRHMDAYIKTVRKNALEQWPKSGCYVFGHIGDGNLHLFMTPGGAGVGTGVGTGVDAEVGLRKKVDEVVYGPLRNLSGSISAEHGIGTEKKAWLGHSRSDIEIRLMQSIKQTLDPKAILNPGVIFDLNL